MANEEIGEVVARIKSLPCRMSQLHNVLFESVGTLHRYDFANEKDKHEGVIKCLEYIYKVMKENEDILCDICGTEVKGKGYSYSCSDKKNRWYM